MPHRMAPKAAAAKSRLGRKAKGATDEPSHKEAARRPKIKKASRELISDEEQNGNKSICRKMGRDRMYHVMRYMEQRGNPHPMALYKELKTRTEKEGFYNKCLKDKKFHWVNMEEMHEASNSTDNTTLEGGMPCFQHDMLPVDHFLTVSKLGSVPSHAHPEQEWRDARDMGWSDARQ